MHAALDWGAQFVSLPALSALRAMSVFGGGCELDAFVAVCVDEGDPPADELLDELVRTSFVTVDFAARPPRYRLLEPVHQYYLWTTGNHQSEGAARIVGLLRTGSGSADARSHAARVGAVVVADLGDNDLVLALSEQAPGSNWPNVECAAGNVDEAEAHFDAAFDLIPQRDRGHDFGLLMARAELAVAAGDPTRAEELAEAALARANEMSMAHDRCSCLRLLGDAQLASGKSDPALFTFQMLGARAGAAPYPCRLAEGHEGAAAAADALGHTRAAHRPLGAAAEIRQRTGTRRVGRPTVESHLVRLEEGRRLSESG
jgi:tetratricopeptide (TPR) repeat protein